MEVLQKFRYSKYILQFRAQAELYLPEYKGSTFRGGFGTAFKKIACIKRANLCERCDFPDQCPYAYIFETSPHADAMRLRNLRDVPRPFVIEPPLDTKGRYLSGDEFEVSLILIGKAIDYLPYFIVSFVELSRFGIGKGRGSFILDSVYIESSAKEKHLIYSNSDQLVRNILGYRGFDEAQKRVEFFLDNRLTLRFITPARLVYEERLNDRLEFHILIRRLLGRISALAYFHCNEVFEIDFKSLIDEASRVKTESSDIVWRDWERYSSRQEVRMKLGGVVGEITYTGELKPFLPFLVLGEDLHVGKGCVFGLGKYELIKKESL